MSRSWSSRTAADARFALRAAGAAVLAVAVTRAAGLPHPLYALVAAVVVSDANPATSRRLGLIRLAGTAAGAVAGAVLSVAFGPALAGVAAAVGGVLLAALALRQPEAGKLAAFVAGVVVLEYSAEPWRYAAARFAETAVGIAAALAFAHAAGLLARFRPSPVSVPAEPVP